MKKRKIPVAPIVMALLLVPALYVAIQIDSQRNEGYL